MRFEVWAPRARNSVDVVVEGERHRMEPVDDGTWVTDVDVTGEPRYGFSIDGGEPRPDPRALRLPDGPSTDGQVLDLAALPWTDQHWRGTQLAGAVVYEMHVGTFTPEGTFDAAVEHLDHLVELGVDMVEVMPIASFPGRHGWGYDGVGLFAVHEPYGGPYAFARFVDACHARGLAVVLDVVYNHLGPSGNHLQEFGPYFTDRYETPWGQALNLDGDWSDDVRRFILDNVELWLRDFHVDGLRLDAVHALFDNRAVTLLEDMSATVSALSARLRRPLWLIAESDRNDPLTVTPRQVGGLGIDAQWADDVHHALHVFLTGETQGYYGDFDEPGALTKALTNVFLHDGTYSTFRRRTHGRRVDRVTMPGWRFVASLQTHDQVGNRAIGDRLSATLSPGRLACGAALLLTAPTTPMLFMGEEWAASTPWQYFTDHTDTSIAEAVRTGRRSEFASHGWKSSDVPDPQSPATVEASRLNWREVAAGDHARVLSWYQALIRLRRRRPDLSDPRLDLVEVDHDVEALTVVVRRGSHHVVVNLGESAAVFELDTTPDVVALAAWDPSFTLDVDPCGATLTVPPESCVIVGPADAAEAASAVQPAQDPDAR